MLICHWARLCCIEIQVRSILDRDQFLALYLARRSIFWVSPMQKILFPYTKDTFCGSLDTEPVSCICIADPNFMYRAQPCQCRPPPFVRRPQAFVQAFVDKFQSRSDRFWATSAAALEFFAFHAPITPLDTSVRSFLSNLSFLLWP